MDVRDLELLRRYEPVVRYTSGEMFFPAAVEGYIERCSVWARAPGRRRELLVPAEKLTAERLTEVGTENPGLALSLRFVQEPLTGRELRHWTAGAHASFRAGGCARGARGAAGGLAFHALAIAPRQSARWHDSSRAGAVCANRR
jgi:hypothetical protein